MKSFLFFVDMNVMLFEENQRVKIADWDGALFIENEMSAADLKPVGTPGFCAPEVRFTLIMLVAHGGNHSSIWVGNCPRKTFLVDEDHLWNIFFLTHVEM